MKSIFLTLLLILCIVAIGCPVQSEHSTEQIQADLIGHQLTSKGLVVWKFAALSEYEKFNIRGIKKQGDVIEYDVSMRLVDLEIDEHFLADVLIVYRKSQDKWELISLVTKVFKHLNEETTY